MYVVIKGLNSKTYQVLSFSINLCFFFIGLFFPTPDEKTNKEIKRTLVTADSFVSRAAVARSGHIVTGGVVHTFTQLLTAIAKRPGRTLCIKTHTPTQLVKHPEPTACKTNT